jgi:acetyl-CoA carboxylase biotin carboxyl carrier protein
MSDMKKIKELITLMKRQKVRRLKINEKGLDVDIELEPTHHAEFHPHPHIPTTHSTPAPAAEPVEASGTFIKSPLVGTFYTSPGPNEPPFIKPGDKVTADTVVCIVEAMKVMNEVRAGVSGTVKSILIEDGSPVEFDTKLIQVD